MFNIHYFNISICQNSKEMALNININIKILKLLRNFKKNLMGPFFGGEGVNCMLESLSCVSKTFSILLRRTDRKFISRNQ